MIPYLRKDALYLAAKKGDIAMVNILLRYRNDFPLDTPDRRGLYRLPQGDQQVLFYGCYPTRRNNTESYCYHMRSPLGVAVEQGHIAVVQTLYETGGVVNTQFAILDNYFLDPDDSPLRVNRERYHATTSHKPSDPRETLLFMAVKRGHTDIVQFLLEAGAAPNIGSCFSFKGDHNKKWYTPLKYYVRTNNISMVKILLKFGAKPDQYLGNNNYHYFKTPMLDFAFDHIHNDKDLAKMARLLLDYGAENTIKKLPTLSLTILSRNIPLTTKLCKNHQGQCREPELVKGKVTISATSDSSSSSSSLPSSSSSPSSFLAASGDSDNEFNGFSFFETENENENSITSSSNNGDLPDDFNDSDCDEEYKDDKGKEKAIKYSSLNYF